MNSYCNAEQAYFANAKTHPGTAANIAAFQNSNNITGLSAPNPLTLQINLMAPASDFEYMMAMPFTSARPVEYDAYVPNSLQLDQHTISDGPYQISSYIPGKSMTLVRNPAWKASTDSLRKAYVDKIVLTIGVTSAQTQLSDMQAGTEDVTNDTPLNPASLPALETGGNPNFKIWPWSSTQPYIVFNLRSPDANGAMNKLLVRQAVEYGLDKVAVQKAYGGPPVGPIINTVIPPGNAGYQNANLYPDNNGQGNVAMCKSDLAKAGYPNGVTLLYMYPNDSTNTRAFEAIQASLVPVRHHADQQAGAGVQLLRRRGQLPGQQQAQPVGHGPGRLDPRLVRQQRPHHDPGAVRPAVHGQHQQLRLLQQPGRQHADHPGGGRDLALGRRGGLAFGGRGHHAGRGDRPDAGPGLPELLERPDQERHVPAEHRRSRHHQPLARQRLTR